MREGGSRGDSGAFLIAQVGAHAAFRFAESLKPHGFTPHDAGILRLLSSSAGISQRELAKRLRMHASRLVGLLDNLEQRRLIERRPSEADRRLYALHLTQEGEAGLRKILEVAREHQRTLLSSLSEDEQAALTEILARIARHQGLTPGVHPGYSRGAAKADGEK